VKIVFSDHAAAQLKNRPRIKREMVLAAINAPDAATASYRNRTLYRKQFDGETLEVVTTTEDDKIIVVTEYFLEQT